MNWKILDSNEQFDALIQSSDPSTYAIFKHSTRCSVSAMSKNRIERNHDHLPDNFQIYYLDLLTYRPISDAIVKVFGVEHQSPQLLLVENGRCVYHASHSEINMAALVEKLRSSQN